MDNYLSSPTLAWLQHNTPEMIDANILLFGLMFSVLAFHVKYDFQILSKFNLFCSRHVWHYNVTATRLEQDLHINLHINCQDGKQSQHGDPTASLDFREKENDIKYLLTFNCRTQVQSCLQSTRIIGKDFSVCPILFLLAFAVLHCLGKSTSSRYTY